MITAPIYTKYYTLASKDDEGAFPVHWPDFSGETPGTNGYLRPADFCGDAYAPCLVRIEHELEWPYAGWDCEDTRPSLKAKLFPNSDQAKPKRYCWARLVATPKMYLME